MLNNATRENSAQMPSLSAPCPLLGAVWNSRPRLSGAASEFRSCAVPAQSQMPFREELNLATIDQITLSTVWYGFQSLCREMRSMVTRTSQSYLISTLKDLSVGVWLAGGSSVGGAEGRAGP